MTQTWHDWMTRIFLHNITGYLLCTDRLFSYLLKGYRICYFIKAIHQRRNTTHTKKIYYGKIEGIKDLVDYHAETSDRIEQAFIDCVDSYIAFCKEIGKEPDIPDMPDEKNQNQPDENILAAYKKIQRLGNIQWFIFNIADYLYTAAWVWFGLTTLLFIIAATVKG